MLLTGTVLLAQVDPVSIRTNGLRNPLGVGEKVKLSWKSTSQASGSPAALQCAAEIEIAANLDTLPLYRFTQSGSSVFHYPDLVLKPKTKYYWWVRTQDCAAKIWSDWSETGTFETGPDDDSWDAGWISYEADEDPAVSNPPVEFHSAFELKKKINHARLYVLSRGLHEVVLNGAPADETLFNPGWSSYNKRQPIRTYDVTTLLAKKNDLVITLADGWFRGVFGQGDRQRNFYGDKLALSAQLEVQFEDGTRKVIQTDTDWAVRTGKIQYADIYNGEYVNERIDAAPYAVSKTVVDSNTALYNYAGPFVKVKERIAARSIFSAPNGDTLIDFGQNLTGRVQITLPKGIGCFVLEHAEVLDAEGNFYKENLRSAKQELKYCGAGKKEFAARFSFMGFRYVRLRNWTGALDKTLFTAEVIYSDLSTTGSFACDDTLVNQLYRNIVWGQRGNFLEVPTDCPQRDERMGWTGDAQVFFNTAAFNMNVDQFFRKWLADLRVDQFEDGRVPHVVPFIMAKDYGAAAGWADAVLLVPWRHYWMYGDVQVLEDNYKAMTAWVDYMIKEAGADYWWNTGNHFGDWNFYRVEPDWYGKSAVTDKHLIAQAYFAHGCDLLADISGLLGKGERGRYYRQVGERARSRFVREYVTASGRVGAGTQTAYVLALDFDLLPDSMRRSAAAKLVTDIRAYKNHLTTGFLGTPRICPVLSRFGYTEVAYELLLQKSYPSWLYTVKQGATTMWERWDGIKKDGSFQDPRMNSFNHYAYGAVGEWLYSNVGGIKAAEPGFKTVRIEPEPGGDLQQTELTYKSVRGEIELGWVFADGLFKLDVKIPTAVEAELVLPAGEDPVMLNGQLVEIRELYDRDAARNKQLVKVGPGNWTISVSALRYR